MGRNLVKVKKILMVSSLILKYDNRLFDVVKTKKVESCHCFFVFGWIKLKFGVRSNLWLLISNLNSKMPYRFQILRKNATFLFLKGHDF